ncbi:hypothetical protein SDC9_111827 [bioreactor metagenome]|uniref:Pycsar effector protein domain-containing protein n=1 Tax=bioreactor metagenome TaxID=1076179 RepID=A0A645BIC7_9ZZZZ
MEQREDSIARNIKTNEIKQTFLASAISDIATYIQLADTKISIIMGSLIALIAGILACYEPISQSFSDIKPCSWLGVIVIIFMLLYLLSTIAVFVFGILTIRGHVSAIGYKSKWFLSQSSKEYSFDLYKQDLQAMTDKDVIENMGAELYKLNDINRQKAKTMKWAIRSFATSLVAVAVIGILLLINAL